MTTMYESSDLRKRVERYESALDDLRAAHQDVRAVLVDQVLYERWQHLGAELGFVPPSAPPSPEQRPHDLASLNQQMSDAWVG